jgi:dolichol-phosphate mannosyltransferase
MPDTESVSIIIPTYNEVENITDLLLRLINVLDKIDTKYEILVIDDASPDNTAEIAQGLLGQKGRVIRRSCDKRSLSLSVLEGIRQARGDIIVVMDGDSSHPPEVIPFFLEGLHQGYDLIIGSRYVKGGGTLNFPLSRKIISRFACFIGKAVTQVKDNTSGFFCIRKMALKNIKLTPIGFKIGLEIFVKTNINTFKEIPYTFANRKKGESKLKLQTVLQSLYQILSLLFYKELKPER